MAVASRAKLTELAARFMGLFAGLDRAYGTYKLDRVTKQDGQKQTGRALTLREPLTIDQWYQHLEGTEGLGVIPIRDDQTCVWGCIDVDVYPLDLGSLSDRLHDTPLVVCRSKSGGAHILLFTEPVLAADMQAKLRTLAAELGYGGKEIFPKQSQLLSERGDVGQWLNMPYFNAYQTTRYAIYEKKNLGPEEFLELGERKRVGEDAFKKLSLVTLQQHNDDVLKESPPCLQLLLTTGFPQGTRNAGLYNIGVFLKKAYPDAWEQQLSDYNFKYMQPPLVPGEVMTVIKSLRKKTYVYKCSDEPICSRCDRPTCRKRKYGVGFGDEDDLPQLGSLTKFNSDPPSYFLNVEGERLGPLDMADMLNQQRFQERCAERVNIVPPLVRPGRWRKIIQDLLNEMTVVEMPEDTGPEGQLWLLLESFCTGRAQAQAMDELLLGRPYTEAETRLTHFQLKDFLAFLERQRFRNLKPHQIPAILRKRGATHRGTKIKGLFRNVWSVQEFEKPEGGYEAVNVATDQRAF